MGIGGVKYVLAVVDDVAIHDLAVALIYIHEGRTVHGHT